LITFWSVAILVFLVVEGVTAGLAAIWFAFGAGAALISALCHAPVWLQILWFCAVSAATLILTRPLVRKYINTKTQPTNADRNIGQEGIVTEAIDNTLGKGSVTVRGKPWAARSADGHSIASGTAVLVTAIEGVKLLVVPLPAGNDKNPSATNGELQT